MLGPYAELMRIHKVSPRNFNDFKSIAYERFASPQGFSCFFGPQVRTAAISLFPRINN